MARAGAQEHVLQGGHPSHTRCTAPSAFSALCTTEATAPCVWSQAGIQLYLRKYGYPFEPCIASDAHPFGDGPGCKKVGFLGPARPRKVGATSGCIGPACKPHF